ncbi:uncharacterized protein LOC108156606 isoform X1 [Drosophila miranda]|uniref:uncharacterized protein LOC108156606 isoform X1 n=1 Tax=Drosophila miranda TaxID=7229 RepID=UPI0007E85722|nr:uncharacterized protein LOC108156606 isoform X1 [Drosophila miranda]
MYLGYVLLFILPVLCSTASTFNYTSCDKAKQPKFMSSCCDVQRDDKAIKTCRKYLLTRNSTTTNNGETRNLKSDKVALHACIAECAFQANGYLLTNGSVNVAALQKSYQQRYKNDATMSQLMVRSLNSCVDYAQKRTQQYQWMHTKDECDYHPATLLACILEQVYANCPATKWKNTDECAAMRKYLLACDDVKSGRK